METKPAKILKTEGNVITAVLRGEKILKVGELNPKSKTGYVVSFFSSSGVIWAVLTTGEQINVNQII